MNNIQEISRRSDFNLLRNSGSEQGADAEITILEEGQKKYLNASCGSLASNCIVLTVTLESIYDILLKGLTDELTLDDLHKARKIEDEARENGLYFLYPFDTFPEQDAELFNELVKEILLLKEKHVLN